MPNSEDRRSALKRIIKGSLATMAAGFLFKSAEAKNMKGKLRNNINHSVCRWTYNYLSLEELCILVKEIGFSAIDLVGPKEWYILKDNGVNSSMCNGAEISLEEGWNNKKYHKTLIKNYSEMIPLVGKAGYKNLICFSGNRNGMDDQEGMENCVEGLRKVLPLAEKYGVILQMELFNSKIDHPDYMCDKSAWGVELCKKLASENLKLLYDIYHMQINEGDIIRTIKDNHQFFGHYHTAGVPGRNEIDDLQELNYPAVMKAIAATGYQGYVAQEFIPKKDDKVASLKEAINLCDV